MASDISRLADYWKNDYNTHLDKGSKEEFINNYERQILNSP